METPQCGGHSNTELLNALPQGPALCTARWATTGNTSITQLEMGQLHFQSSPCLRPGEGSPCTHKESWREPQTSAFSLAQPQPLRPIGQGTSAWVISLSLSLLLLPPCHPGFPINTSLKNKENAFSVASGGKFTDFHFPFTFHLTNTIAQVRLKSPNAAAQDGCPKAFPCG